MVFVSPWKAIWAGRFDDGIQVWEPSLEDDSKTTPCLPHKDVQRGVYNHGKLRLPVVCPQSHWGPIRLELVSALGFSFFLSFFNVGVYREKEKVPG